MTQNQIHRYDALLISYAVHVSLALVFAGALWINHSAPIAEPKKIAIKLRLDTPKIPPHSAPIPPAPIQAPTTATTPVPIAPKPLPITSQPIVPVKTVPPAPLSAPIPLPQPKVSEPAPIIPVKSVQLPPPPPPPPPKENYAEENIGKIRAILNERKVYPKNAKRLNQQGDVTVTFSLSSEGEVSAIVINESSGFELLDNAARDLIEKSADAFPKPKRTVRITVPIGYSLR